MTRHTVRHDSEGCVVVRPGIGAWFETMPGERATILVHSEQVEGRFTLMEQISAPMSGPPLHSHLEEEVFQILEGTITFVCDNERFEAKPGTVVTVPAGMAHAWANLTDRQARMRTLFMPGGLEEMFTGMAGLYPAEIGTLAEKFGSRVLGPPIR